LTVFKIKLILVNDGDGQVNIHRSKHCDHRDFT